MTQTSGMITCIHCGHINRVGIIFCEKCGNSLDSIPVTYETNVLSKSMAEKIEDQLSDTVKVDELNDVQGSPSLFQPNMELLLEIEGISNLIKLKPQEGHEYIIGRHDPEGGFMPAIDLLPFGGYRMGISRKHAMLTLVGKRLNIRDLGSSNGTSVNGNRLDQHEDHQLRDGDKLRMGSMAFRVRFV